MTDGLVAVMGDWVMGLVSSNGSIPGLAGKISADPISLWKVTSESVDSSCIMTQCLTSGSHVTHSVCKALTASSYLKSKLNLAIAEASEDRNLVADPSVKIELDPATVGVDCKVNVV